MSNLYLQIPSGNKAKEDIDKVMFREGFRDVAWSLRSQHAVARFVSKLVSVLLLTVRVHKGDVLLVQYPFKKYYALVCRIVHWRGGKVVTLIHDLGCFRRKKLSVEQEMLRLSYTDVLIVHNEAMQQFLVDHGYKRPMLTLGIFDYLSSNQPELLPTFVDANHWEIVYAGGLAERKNKFLYALDEAVPTDCVWYLHIHGKGLDETKAVRWTHVIPEGFIQSDDFIRYSIGQFGLVWDGSSIDECAGDWGEYLKVNNPHKTSFYLRAGKPVIIWKKAALAHFVEHEGVGITVGSLRELHERLQQLTADEYAAMVERVQQIRERLASGYYFVQAFEKAQQMLS